VNDELVLAFAQIEDFYTGRIGQDLLAILHEEFNRRIFIFDLNIENDFLSFNALFELAHALDEAIVGFNVEGGGAGVGVGPDLDVTRVFQLGPVDEQLALLAILDDDNSFAVGNNFDAVFEPLDLGIVLFDLDFEFDLVVLHTVFSLELRGEFVGELADGKVTSTSILAFFTKFFDLTSVLAGVLELALLDGEAAVAPVVLHEEPGVGGQDLHAVLEPFDLGVAVVDLATHFDLLFGLAVFLKFQCLFKPVFRIRRFDVQYDFACQIIALANHAGVPAAIARLGVLDDKSEQVFVLCHGVFFAFVAFLVAEVPFGFFTLVRQFTGKSNLIQ